MNEAQKIIKYGAIGLAVVLIIGIVYGVLGITGALIGFSNSGTGEMRVLDEDTEIVSLEIEVAAVALKIENGKTFKASTDSDYIQYTNDNGKVKITEKSGRLIHGDNGTLNVVLPEDVVFEDISIDTGAGKVEIEKLTAKTLDLNLGVGEINIGSLNISGQADVEGGAGKVTVSGGTVNSLDLDMGVGELEFCAAILSSGSMNLGIGDADIKLIGKEEYSIRVNKGIGSASLEGDEMQNDKWYGEGANKIDIDGGIGDIDITFDE